MYTRLFKELNLFLEKQNEQKMRGLNDYNILNVVRKENAEVGMHSNVIFSLIDPYGVHYQGELFLNLFIQHVLDIENFGEITSVQAEEATNDNRRIDFTIKSDKYYIGIEMKVDANDLENQIYDYYKDLNEKAIDQQVKIYYLTKYGTEADSISRGKVEPINISFKKHILNWINMCQNEVKNITNLNYALESYKTIVHKITNQYSSNLTALEDVLIANPELFKDAQQFHAEYEKDNKFLDLDEMHRIVFEGYQRAREKVNSEFFIYKLPEYLKTELDDTWDVKNTSYTDDHKYKIIVKNKYNTITIGSQRYSDNNDYYELNQSGPKLTKYRYRYADESINAFYHDDGKKAKEYFRDLIQDI